MTPFTAVPPALVTGSADISLSRLPDSTIITSDGRRGRIGKAGAFIEERKYWKDDNLFWLRNPQGVLPEFAHIMKNGVLDFNADATGIVSILG
jgi:hypothetical protein